MTVHEVRSRRADPVSPTFGDVLAAALAEAPEACAFRHRNVTLTRGDLLAAMSRTARELAEAGLQPGEPVAIEIRHGFALCVAMGGVLLAGGCAVPLEPEIAPLRRKAILDDIEARMVLKAEGHGARVDIFTTRSPLRSFDPEIAFIVYTSGSTGGPKGVEITHASYAERLQTIAAMGFASVEDVDLAWTPSSFIGMLDEIFYPLLVKVPAIIADPDIRTDFCAVADLIERERITTFRTTPSLLNAMLNTGLAPALGGVRAIYCSGEPLPADLQIRAHAALNANIIGFYGATEAPGVAFHLYDREAEPLATTICTPQSFAELRVSGPDGKALRTGKTGEVWIGGCAIARGYWNKPDLTAEKFIVMDGRRWYRSGDLGRALADGRIEILGRVDATETKINGVRVNLLQIRNTLCVAPGVSDAWISVAEGSPPSLVAHYVAPRAIPAREIKDHLRLSLGPQAIPQRYVHHVAFPITVNGKLDLQALLSRTRQDTDPEPRADAPIDAPLLPEVLETAQELLETDGLKPTDNFFDIGGDSLLAVQYALSLGERIGVKLSSTLLFDADTFEDVATAIRSGKGHAAKTLKMLRQGTGEDRPLFTVSSTGNYIALARHLDPRPTIYNLNIFGLTNELEPVLDTYSLADLAERLADQVEATDPTGPWRLMAYCQDGCLAVEIARALENRTGIRSSLLLIDTFFTDHRVTWGMKLWRFVDLRPGEVWRKLRKRRHRSTRPGRGNPGALRQRAVKQKRQNDRRLYARFTHHYMTYTPDPYYGVVTLCISSEWRRADLSSVTTLAARGLRIRNIDGLHNLLFKPEVIPGLARAMDDAIADLAAKGL